MLSEQFCTMLAGFDPAALPASTRAAASRVLLDATGVMLGASGMAREVDPFVALALASGSGPAVILGTGQRVPASAAALANGAMAHALDFEDAFDLAPGHPNASLVPALLALAQAQGPLSGQRFLTALAIGCEVSCRMGLALRRPMEAGGWYPPPILAGFGAAAGAAYLLGLDGGQMRDALSLMLCQTTMPGEIKYSVATEIRAVREAFPAQAAVQAVLLAQAGVRGFEQPLEGRAGFYALYAGGEFDPDKLLAPLDQPFWIEQLTFKPWPSCRGTHPFIEMALDLRARHGLTAPDIAGIEIQIDGVQQMLVEPAARKAAPANAIDAKFSIPFTLALALARGRVGLDDFSAADLGDADLLALAARVQPQVAANPGWQMGSGGALAIVLHSGARLEAQCSNARGCPAKPLGEGELLAKFIDCAARARQPLAGPAAKALADTIFALDQFPDVGALFTWST